MTDRSTETAPGPRAPAQPSGPPHPRTEDASTGELVNRVSEQLSELVRSELELARAEIGEAGRRAGRGAGLLGGAGVLALCGLGGLVATLVLVLALLLPAWLAALIVTLVFFAAAGVTALVGKKEVAQAPPAVQTSVESVQEDVRTVKQGGRS